MAHDEPAASGAPSKLAIKNVGLMLSGDLEKPILDADAIVAVNGRGGGEDRRRRAGVASARQDVQDDVGRMNVLGERLGAGGLDRRQPVGEHRGEDLDHLPVAVVRACELAPDPVQRRRRHPIFERRAVAERAGLPRQDRNVAQGVVDRPAATGGPPMLGDDPPVLADDDAVGVGVDVDRTADGAGADRVSVVVEPDEAGLRY
jgi:hypothetical protein